MSKHTNMYTQNKQTDKQTDRQTDRQRKLLCRFIHFHCQNEGDLGAFDSNLLIYEYVLKHVKVVPGFRL